MRFFSYVMVIIAGLCLQACSLIDDYILGKDNTLLPTPLTDIKAKVVLHKVWSTSVGKPTKSRTYLKLKPVVQDHTIYTADLSGSVSAVAKATGHIRWSVQLKHPVVSGPTVAHGYVVVGTDDATLVLLSQADGHQVWEAHLSGEALSKPAMNADTVIAKTINGHLYAFDLASGKQKWMADHGSPNLILKASSSPKMMGSLVLVGYSDGKLDAMDVSTGRMIWQRSIAYANGASDVERLVDIDADPMIRNNVVYLASYQGYVGALRLDDGQFIWSKPASVYKNIALDEDTAYVTDSKDVLWAYRLSNGQIKWKQTALKAHDVTEPVLIGNRLVVGDKTGYLHVLSKLNGELIGRLRLSAAIDISPAQAGERIVVLTADGLLQSFQMKAMT